MIIEALLSAAVGSGLAWIIALGRSFYRRHIGRSLWQVTDPLRYTIALATSQRISTQTYQRPVTGLGQARALAIATSSLTSAYRTFFMNTAVLSEHCADERREHDLLLLGGPKNNRLTREVLELIDEQLPYTMKTEGDEVMYRRELANIIKLDTPRYDKAGRIWDYGLIVRCPSPYKPQSRVTIFAGMHTHGTMAAASFFVANSKELRKHGAKNYALIVRAIVTQSDHMYPPELYAEAVIF